jgi:site-specific DNA recombinase
LQIIDDDVFAQAQEIMRQRTQPHSSIPLNCKGKSLLVGNIYCAHCGNRLTLTTSGRNKKMPDGTIQKEVRMRYQCHYNVPHPGECEGQSGYSVNKVDGIVDQLIRMKFSEIEAASESEILSSQHEKDIELARSTYEIAKKHLIDKQKELDDYKGETLKVIRRRSKLSIDLLNMLVAETESQIQEAQTNADTAEATLQELLETSEGLKREYDRLLSWADLYDKSSFEAKKMIVSQFIKAVRVGRDYNIEVDFNVSFEELQSFCTSDSNQDKIQALESRTA